jgi:hypothetical protein
MDTSMAAPTDCNWPEIPPRLLTLMNKILLRKRCIIETMNDQLKHVSQLAHSRHRSCNNFRVNVIGALIAYTHQEKKPSINVDRHQYQAVVVSACLSETQVTRSQLHAKFGVGQIATICMNHTPQNCTSDLLHVRLKLLACYVFADGNLHVALRCSSFPLSILFMVFVRFDLR